MQDDKIINTLTDRVQELLERYSELTQTCESLRNELVSVKAQNEAKTNEILRLEEELKSKNIASEDLIAQIGNVLGR